MSRYGIDLYAVARAGDGPCHRLETMRQRSTSHGRRSAFSVDATADGARHGFGIEFEFVSPAEAGGAACRSCARTTSPGAVWIPGDGKANPTDLAQSLAKGARMRGATIVEGIKVTAVGPRCGARQRNPLANRGMTRARSPAKHSSIARANGRAPVVSPRRRQRAALLRRAFLPRHQGAIAGVDFRHAGDSRSRRLPCITRRKSVGSSWAASSPQAKPWNVDPIPDGFEFQLLPGEDWDHFEILMENAIHRTPCLETSRSEAAAEQAGKLHARRQLHPRRSAGARPAISCAPDSTRPASPTPAAQASSFARVVVNGAAPRSTCGTSTRGASRRFTPIAGTSPTAQIETLGLHYAMRWPREELATVRPLRALAALRSAQSQAGGIREQD